MLQKKQAGGFQPFKTLITLIALFVCTITTAQVRALDSVTVAVDVDEFKNIIGVNIALDACDSMLTAEQLKVGILKRLVADRQQAVEAYDERVRLLESSLEAQRPAWIDRFIPGFVAGAILTAGLVVLTR